MVEKEINKEKKEEKNEKQIEWFIAREWRREWKIHEMMCVYIKYLSHLIQFSRRSNCDHNN